MPDSAKKRVAIYARSSWNVRNTGAQLESCRRVASVLEFDVSLECIDENIPGTTTLESRAGGRELLAGLDGVDAVLVDRLDRLSRSPTALAETVRLLEGRGLEIWSVGDLPFPTRISTDQVAGIGAFAESERAAIGHRRRSGRNRAARTGRWLGGPVPFGYDLDSAGALTPSHRLVAGMTEAEVARSIFQAIAAGSSTIKEARRMNELGIFPGRRYSRKTVRMRRANWLPSRINAMVRNPLYKGVHYFDAADGRIERNVAALVSADLWQAAQNGIRANRAIEPGRPSRQYLLTGLVFCDDCGVRYAATRVRHQNWLGVYYRCSGQIGVVEPDPALRCRAKMIPAASLEALIWETCIATKGDTIAQLDFDGRRKIVRELVRRITVQTTEQRTPKVALVKVEYADGHIERLNFKRGDGRRI